MTQKKEINIQIGERVKCAREKLNLTQERFAELINVSPQYISDMERGKTGVSVSTLRKICVALSVSCDILLLGREIENSAYSRIVNQVLDVDPAYLPMLERIIQNYMEAVTLDTRLNKVSP